MLTQATDLTQILHRDNAYRLAALNAPTLAQARAAHAEADRWMDKLKEAGKSG